MKNRKQNQSIYCLVAPNDIMTTRSDHTGASDCAEYGVRNGGTAKRCRRDFFHSTNCERIYALISETEKLRQYLLSFIGDAHRLYIDKTFSVSRFAELNTSHISSRDKRSSSHRYSAACLVRRLSRGRRSVLNIP